MIKNTIRAYPLLKKKYYPHYLPNTFILLKAFISFKQLIDSKLNHLLKKTDLQHNAMIHTERNRFLHEEWCKQSNLFIYLFI